MNAYRQPQASLQVFDSKGKELSCTQGRFGNTNILEASDFIWIESGKGMNLAPNGLFLYSGFFKQAGTYTVKVTYSTKWTGGPMGPDGIKKVKKECGDLFQKREKIAISAEVKIKIVAKAK